MEIAGVSAASGILVFLPPSVFPQVNKIEI